MPEPECAGEEIALFPLHTVLFPGGPLPLRIFEPRYIDMVRRSLRAHTVFGVVLMEGGNEAGAAPVTATIGTSARIADFNPLPDWLAAEREIELPDEYQRLGQLLRKVLPELGDFYQAVAKRFEDSAWVGYRLAEILPLSLADKQYCLELDNPLARLARLSPLIQRPD